MTNEIVENVKDLNTSFIKFLEIPVIKYGFLILVIIQIIMIDSLSTAYLELYDNNKFKVVYAFLIAYYACFDPIYAIALTTLMIVAIQELHNRRSKNRIGSVPIPEIYKPHYIPGKNKQDKYNFIIDTPNKKINSNMIGKVLNNDGYIYDEINKHALQKQPSNSDKLTGEYDFYNEPAYKTLTDNITENEISSNNIYKRFITEDDLYKMESNKVPGANQNVSIQTNETQMLNIQGLPNGNDTKSSKMEYVKNM